MAGENGTPESPIETILRHCLRALQHLESQKKYLADDLQAHGHNHDAAEEIIAAIKLMRDL